MTILFYLLESSFESFSRISLAKFLKGMQRRAQAGFRLCREIRPGHPFPGNGRLFPADHPADLHVPGAARTSCRRPRPRILLIGLLYLVFFNLIFYIVAYLNREKVLRSLLFLFPGRLDHFLSPELHFPSF